MLSSSEDTTPDSEYNDRSFENPNYRKLYAALSMTSMIGKQNENNDNNVIETRQQTEQSCDSSELPIEWQKFEDDSGPYYWHIPSGTIQRDEPQCSLINTRRDSLIYYDNNDAFNDKMVESSNKCDDNSITFIVHSLGWVDVEEDQLTASTTSKVIQKCIFELNTRGDNNAVRCWGNDTQNMILKIDNCCLKLYDITSNTLLKSQTICGIRVWGVNDNNDFAYVARDEHNSMLKCYVFHCEDDNNMAQKIATHLRDEMIKLKTNNELSYSPSSPCLPLPHNQRPKQLFIYDNNAPLNITTPTAIEFPTPIEEPRKSITAKYMGKTKVSKPTGIEVLNDAFNNLVVCADVLDNDKDSYRANILVSLHISPSNIIIEAKDTNECIAECRVRYLSFLGISGQNVKHCGFIMQIDDNQFEAFCFECEPSSGALCKTIEAACKLRFQKCLDAHRQRYLNENQSQNFSIKSAIRNVFSKILK